MYPLHPFTQPLPRRSADYELLRVMLIGSTDGIKWHLIAPTRCADWRSRDRQ
jgi:hypothetical protein